MGEGAVQEPGDVARLKPCLVYINLHPFEEDRRKATVWTWKKGLYQSLLFALPLAQDAAAAAPPTA